jgi:hypothetical protein
MRRTMPVHLTVRGDMDVAGSDFDRLVTARLHETVAINDVEGLTAFVGMPGGAGARREVDSANVECRIAVRFDDGVD